MSSAKTNNFKAVSVVELNSVRIIKKRHHYKYTRSKAIGGRGFFFLCINNEFLSVPTSHQVITKLHCEALFFSIIMPAFHKIPPKLKTLFLSISASILQVQTGRHLESNQKQHGVPTFLFGELCVSVSGSCEREIKSPP